MLARVFSCAVIGLEREIIEIEVDIGRGLPGMTIVGLPDAAVQESRAGLLRQHLLFPFSRIACD